jgi:aspartate/tyrosine/aromatic aminotransferase
MLDERSGSHYAKLLHEKGFDNVYLLSGGIEKFIEDHHDLVEGTDVPAVAKPKIVNTSKYGGLGKASMRTSQTSFKTNATKK